MTVGLAGLLFFRSKIFTKNNIIFLFSIFSVIFLAFIIFKTHDDFGYYHFPYSYYLNKFSMIIGIGPLNHGFRTPSSIFYLNSLFYLPGIKYFLMNSGAVYIFGFVNTIIIIHIIFNLFIMIFNIINNFIIKGPVKEI